MYKVRFEDGKETGRAKGWRLPATEATRDGGWDQTLRQPEPEPRLHLRQPGRGTGGHGDPSAEKLPPSSGSWRSFFEEAVIQTAAMATSTNKGHNYLSVTGRETEALNFWVFRHLFFCVYCWQNPQEASQESQEGHQVREDLRRVTNTRIC